MCTSPDGKGGSDCCASNQWLVACSLAECARLPVVRAWPMAASCVRAPPTSRPRRREVSLRALRLIASRLEPQTCAPGYYVASPLEPASEHVVMGDGGPHRLPSAHSAQARIASVALLLVASVCWGVCVRLLWSGPCPARRREGAGRGGRGLAFQPFPPRLPPGPRRHQPQSRRRPRPTVRQAECGGGDRQLAQPSLGARPARG